MIHLLYFPKVRTTINRIQRHQRLFNHLKFLSSSCLYLSNVPKLPFLTPQRSSHLRPCPRRAPHRPHPRHKSPEDDPRQPCPYRPRAFPRGHLRSCSAPGQCASPQVKPRNASATRRDDTSNQFSLGFARKLDVGRDDRSRSFDVCQRGECSAEL